MRETILKLTDMCKDFSGIEVLKNVNLVLREKSILGLVGENGAGKSTLMNILGGVHRMSSGKMELFGENYEPRSPMDAKMAGIAFIHQELNLFSNMTVAENMFIDSRKHNRFGFISAQSRKAETEEVLRRLNIHVDANTKIENVPIGIRQLIEIAKAIVQEARIIILDEPTTSLSNKEKDALFELMSELRKQNVSMIYISHALDDIIKMSDEVVVLRDGSTIGEQTAVDQITKDEIIKRMIGREISQLYPYLEKSFGDEALGVRGITKRSVVQDISFSLRKGEILGLYGLMGAGRSELANILFGIDKPDSGDIYFYGNKKDGATPISWVQTGMAYITESRRENDLLLPKSVEDNLILVSLKNFRKKSGALDRKLSHRKSQAMNEHLNIKTYNQRRQTVGSLSGGNQQKVVIGKWLMIEPKVFIIDEPTRGVDVGAKYEIYTHINELTKTGSSVLFISSEMEELMGVCDRIMVMCKGRISGVVERADFLQDTLIRLALGEN